MILSLKKKFFYLFIYFIVIRLWIYSALTICDCVYPHILLKFLRGFYWIIVAERVCEEQLVQLCILPTEKES